MFALENIADELMGAMEKAGAVRLNAAQLDQLTQAAFTFKEGREQDVRMPSSIKT